MMRPGQMSLWGGGRWRACPTARGFTLIELLSALTLYAVFSLLATSLFMATMRITHDTHVLAARVPVEVFRTQLERDVWGAASLSADEDGLMLALPQGGRISWHYAPGTLTRTVSEFKTRPASQSPRTYRCPDPIHFAVDGSIVRCSIDAPAASSEPASIQAAAAGDSILVPGHAAMFTLQSQLLLEAHP